MTDTDTHMIVHPGAGIVARFGEGVLVMLPGGSDAIRDRLLSTMEQACKGTDLPGSSMARAFVGILSMADDGDLPPFGACGPNERGWAVVLHGAVAAKITRGDRMDRLSGHDASTWVDRIIDGDFTSLAFTPDGQEAGQLDTRFRFHGGVIPGGGVTVLRERDGAAAADSGSHPVSHASPQPAVEAPRPAVEAPRPSAETSSPAAESSPPPEDPTVPTPVMQVPPAAEAPPATASGDDVAPGGRTLSDAAQAVAAEGGGQAPSAPGDDPDDPDDLDDLDALGDMAAKGFRDERSGMGEVPPTGADQPPPLPARDPSTEAVAPPPTRPQTRPSADPAPTPLFNQESLRPETAPDAPDRSAPPPDAPPAEAAPSLFTRGPSGDPVHPAATAPDAGQDEPSPGEDDVEFHAVPLTDIGPDVKRDPLPVLTEDTPKDDAVADESSPLVYGVLSPAGYFNHPDALYCAVTGVSMLHRTHVLVQRPRPPLGVIVADDGSTFTLNANYIVGREPEPDEAVVAGEARPLKLTDSERSLSRIHAEFRLVDWDVYVVDRESINGTYILQKGGQQWQRLSPGNPEKIQPGTRVAFGKRIMTFESHHQINKAAS